MLANPNRLGIGGNQPPDALALAPDTTQALSTFLKDTPVIQTEDEARAAKVQLDRAKAAADELEAERKALIEPLRAKVADINAPYHALHNENKDKPGLLDRLMAELRKRLTAFAKAEEAKRLAVAQAAREAAAEAEAKARLAEENERAASSEAAMGVLDVDVAQATIAADAAFADFERAGRIAQRAEKDAKVRIGGGFGKVAALRTREILTVTDWKAAIEEVGCTERIREAIITEARAYRSAFGELPEGIAKTTERAI